MPKLLLIGHSRSGKTTVAKHIRNHPEFALANALKMLVYKLLKLFNIPIHSVDDLNDDDKKEQYRTYMQHIGTECCRTIFGDDIWCELVNKKIKDLDSWIISDIRFKNEYEYFTTRYPDSITIFIDKSFNKTYHHSSEQDIDLLKSSCNYVIHNDGDINELYNKVDKLMSKIDSDKSIPTVDEQSSITIVDDKSITIVDEQPSITIVDDKSITIVDEQPSITIVDDKSITIVDEQPSITIVDDKSITIVDEQPSITIVDDKSITIVDEQPSIPTVDEQPSITAVDSDKSITIVDEQPSITAVDSDKSITIVDEQPSIPTVDEQPSITAVDSDKSITIVDEQPSITAVDSDKSIEKIISIPDDEQPSIPTVDSDKSITIVDEQPSITIVDEQPSIPTVDSDKSIEKIISIPDDEQPSIPTVDSEKLITIVDEQPSITIVDSDKSIPTFDDKSITIVDEQPSITIVDSDKSITTVDNDKSTTVDNDKSIPTVDEQPSIPTVDNDKSITIVDEQPSIPKSTSTKHSSSIPIPIPDTFPMSVSNYVKGMQGEEYVKELIVSIRPKFEIIMVSATGHMADIHVIDYDSNIKYVIEVKNKDIITYQDVTKFKKDIEEMNKTNEKIIGLFISLNADTIPNVGTLSVTKNMIYLTKRYINKECLSIVFDYTSIDEQIIKQSAVKYEIPKNVYILMSNLHILHNNLTNEIDKLQNIKKNMKENISEITVILIDYESKMMLLKEILKEFPSNTEGTKIKDKYFNKLSEYLMSVPRSKLKKSEILSRFPMIKSELSALKMDEILQMYRR